MSKEQSNELEIVVPGVPEEMVARMRGGELRPSEVFSLLTQDTEPSHRADQQKAAMDYLGRNTGHIWPVIHELERATEGTTDTTLDEGSKGWYSSVRFSDKDGVQKSPVVYERSKDRAYAQAGLILLHTIFNIDKPLPEDHQYAKARLKKIVDTKFSGSKIVYDFTKEKGLVIPLFQGTVRLETDDSVLKSHPMREVNEARLERVTATDLIRKLDAITHYRKPLRERRTPSQRGKQMAPPRR